MDLQLKTVSKAIAGALVTMFMAYLTKNGFTFEPVVGSSLTTLLDAILSALGGFLVVYFAPRNQE